MTTIKAQPESPPDPFGAEITKWRQKYKLRDDDPILLTLELFQIHQNKWDFIRRQEMPATQEFRDAIKVLHQQALDFSRQVADLAAELGKWKNQAEPPRPAVEMAIAAVTGLLVGILIGRFVQ